MRTTNDPIYEVKKEIYGYTREKFTPGAPSVKVYIPDLMGNIKGASVMTNQNVRVAINQNKMFANASACKPPLYSSVSMKDYITVPIQNNIDWTPKVILPENYVPIGTRVLIRFISGNLQDPLLINWN